MVNNPSVQLDRSGGAVFAAAVAADTFVKIYDRVSFII